jgi:anti-sigma factor RsiW
MRVLSRFRRGGPDPLVCREFVELITDYLEGALPPRDHARFEAHLAGCDACHTYFDSLRLTIHTLQELPPPPADPHAREVLLTAFRELRG